MTETEEAYRATLWADDARALEKRLTEYEDCHPAKTVCLAGALQEARASLGISENYVGRHRADPATAP